MALISLRQLLDHAAEYNYGVPAFNVNNLEQTRAIMEAAAATDSPVIMQASAGARKYAGAPFLRAMMEAAMHEFPHIPVVVHQDHGVSIGVCQRSIQLGFSSVMMDGSLGEDGKTPMDYDYNVDITRRAVEIAHACGVSVEGELGCLGSLETGEAGEEDGIGAEGKLTHDQMLTDPEEAALFVRATHVDALAIACGTSHGAYKFTRPPTGDILAIDRIKEIHARIPHTHLVMHGSSAVPQDWLAIINEYGGQIPETYGVPVEQVQEGIRHGVRKVNIDTDLRLASTGAIRRFLAKNPAEFDPRKYLAHTITAMKDICIARYEAFGTAGNASKISVRSLSDMQLAYESGALTPSCIDGRRAQRPVALTPEQLQRLRESLPPFGDNAAASPELAAFCHAYGLDFAAHLPQVVYRAGTISSGAFTLAVHRWCQSGARANLLLLHGYFDHSGLYNKLIGWALAQRCNVLIFDLPGHGLSSGEPAVIDDFGDYSRAIDAVLRAASLPALPWWVMAQSTGCAALMDYAANYASKHTWPFAATVLLAPLVRPAAWHGVNVAHRLLNPFVGSIKRTFAANSSDREFRDFLQRDPLQCRRTSLRWVGALRRWLRALVRRDLGVGPALVIQGDADATVDWRYNVGFVGALFPGSRVEYLPGAGHQLANEAESYRRTYLASVVRWLALRGIVLDDAAAISAAQSSGVEPG